jgi:glycosyltransferase involved in cell wall biosynthesis
MIDFYASLPHFYRHLAPIMRALTPHTEVRGWSRGGECEWPVMKPLDREAVNLAVVASWDDAQRFPDKRTVYVEHGAGQQYVGTNGSGYAGAPGLDHVVLFLCPNETVAARWQRAYPDAQVDVVGSPALDLHFARLPVTQVDDDRSAHHPPVVVALTFHWRCSICPETMPALPHYEAGFPALVASLRVCGMDVLGSAHPRGRGSQRQMWDRLGVRYEPDPDRVLQEASLLVADNTSLLPEAAAAGVPLVWLNAPWYRRDVQHGGRFWDWPRGQVQCDEPDQLMDAIVAALDDPAGARAAREAMVDSIYADRDGCSAERAAAAIASLRQ